jgi:sugar lactone lactonase YvrE
MKHILRIILTVLIVAVISGCAPAPVKKKGPVIFYPQLPQQPRIQFLKSIMFETDLARKRSRFDEFLIGAEPIMKRVGRPVDFATKPGKIYASDRLFKKILIVDLIKNEFNYLRDQGMGTIYDPAGLWRTEDGLLYLADMERKQVLVYNNNDAFLTAYGEADQFSKPTDVAVYGNRIYVCDINKNMVLVVDKESGRTIQEIGGLGKEEGKFFKPAFITLDKDGNLYVTDSFNFRVQVFDREGKFLRTIGCHGDNFGCFTRPKDLVRDDENLLYVVDAAFENIQIFDSETAQLLMFFGGQGRMELPAGLYLDTKNVAYFQKFAHKDFKVKYLLIVGNLFGNRRISIYGYGDWTGPILPGMKRPELPK